ncbi:DUF1905 domain-containing protein [Novosphingobium cyanobacteriorum]|uniref:DUF1905 domain-containing protein n=1 Tax=Novosphingobium cyanobacteriorum TaxID=3024215 RepID=A0ABT6CI46_9SPHN|nr:DUF1905 domain-containing protein [Novosphingobium cyanobacteriorum]MDF8333595.1 DUF1905 domain-containing protein [Novosphingobium cyanobacteriorum]
MEHDDAALAQVAFYATLIEWRGPAPFVFAPVPEEHVGEIAHAARSASYGWGVVPVEAQIGRTRFTTSLFPRNGGYLLPVKVAVQRSESIAPGSSVAVLLVVR